MQTKHLGHLPSLFSTVERLYQEVFQKIDEYDINISDYDIQAEMRRLHDKAAESAVDASSGMIICSS